jgi:hypothetical protein
MDVTMDDQQETKKIKVFIKITKTKQTNKQIFNQITPFNLKYFNINNRDEQARIQIEVYLL